MELEGQKCALKNKTKKTFLSHMGLHMRAIFARKFYWA